MVKNQIRQISSVVKLLEGHERHCHIHQIRKRTVDLEEMLNPVDEFVSVASPPKM